MQISTKALVLSSIKYGDTSLIVRCYTELAGVKSYILRGLLKNRKGKLKPAHFQALNQLELVVNHRNKTGLNTIKEVRVLYNYQTIYTDFVKQSVVFFISEMLTSSIREEEVNKTLFSYLETSLKWFDLHNRVANFHLVFLMNLTKYLGFYPEETNKKNSCFHMQEGRFSSEVLKDHCLIGNDLMLFKSLLGINFDTIDVLSFSASDKQRLLEIVITYFELHMSWFRRPKSLYILKELFR